MHPRLLTAFLLLLAVTARSQTLINLYVDSSKTASGSGTSWTGAYKTLNEALNVANSGSTGTVYNVFVAKGTYYPTGIQISTNRDSAFLLLRLGLHVYGGYPTGGGTRNTATNPTLLSGNIGSPVDSVDNSYHVVLVKNNGSSSLDSTVLDGVQVVWGYAIGTGSYNLQGYAVDRSRGGGAFLCTSSSRILLRGCQFLRSRALNGGGLYNEADSTVILGGSFGNNTSSTAGGGVYSISRLRVGSSCLFTGNVAQGSSTGGGGIYLVGSPSALSLADCSFTGNATSGTGGALLFDGTASSANFLASGLTFSGNSAQSGGAVGWFAASGSTPGYQNRFLNCTFTGNKAGSFSNCYGGAMVINPVAPVVLDTCAFTANTAGGGGGGVFVSNNTLTITGCSFQNDSSVNGGALQINLATPVLSGCTLTGNYGYNGGAIWTNQYATLTDCTLESNRADNLGGAFYGNGAAFNRCRIRGNRGVINGGGLYVTPGSGSTTTTLASTILSGNRAGTNGGAVAVVSTSSIPAITVTNCTFAGDSALNGNGLYVSGVAVTALNSIFGEGASNTASTGTGGSFTATYSIIQSGLTGTGNSSSNPLFVTPLAASAAPTAGGNYSLTACSPAINAGLNSGSYTGVLDAAGNPRLTGTAVDRGAYEFQPSSVTGTISGLPSGAFCAGGTAQLTSSVSGGTWSNPAPMLVAVSNTGLVTAGTTAGTDTVIYTVVSGGCAVQNTQIITVAALPVIAATTGASTVCSNGSTLLGNTTPGGTWSSTNTAFATVNTAGLVTGVASGTVTIRYKVTNSGGCSDSVSKVLTVVAPPTVAAITAPSAGVCPGKTLQLSNTTPGGTWSSACTVGGVTVSTTGLVTGVSSGSCTVSYTVTNSSGCTATANRTVTVYATPATPVITGPATVCSVVPTPYTAAPTGATWTWSVTNSSVATITPVGGVLTGLPAGGVTDVVYTSTNGNGCTGTGMQTVTVNTPVAQSIAANLCSSGPGYVFGTQVLTTAGTYTQTFPAANGCDSVVTLTLTGAPRPDTTVLPAGAGLIAIDTGVSYQWLRCLPNGTQIPLAGKTGRLFIAPISGSYAVTVTKNGCSATSGCHLVTLPATGIDQMAADDWGLYPNPTTGAVTVQTGTAPARMLTVCDATGKHLLTLRPTGPETTLHLEGWAPGLYLVTLTDVFGASRTLRVTLTGR